MIAQFTVSATDLMAAFLGMSGLAMLITFLAASVFVTRMNFAGTSLLFGAVRASINFVSKKMWTVSLLSMLAIYNVVGGAAACAMASTGMFDNKIGETPQLVATLTVALVAAVSLSGSLIAWTKINGLIKEPSGHWGWQAFCTVVIAIVLVMGGDVVLATLGSSNLSIVTSEPIIWLLGSTLILGALITLPFSRAQMPVLISFYNAGAGLAIGLEGVVLRNEFLLIAGIVIGTARLFVTHLMVEASHENWDYSAHASTARISRRYAPRLSNMRGRHKPL